MDPDRKWKLVRIVLTTVFILPGWLLFTGSFAPYPLALGVFFSFLTARITYGVFIERHEAEKRSLLPKLHLLAAYLLLVVFEMYISSFKVLAAILTGRINPRVVHFRTRLKSDIARTVLAGSITLTPGTVTLNIDDDHLIVHWLNARTGHSSHAGDMIKGRMERLLKKVWV